LYGKKINPLLSPASGRKDGGVHRARNLQRTCIHSTFLQFWTSPRIHDTLQHASSIHDQGRVRDREWRRGKRVEHSRVGCIQEGLSKRWVLERSYLVVGVFGNKGEDVGAYVVSSESRQVPVGFDGGYLRVVIVEGVVGGSDEMLRDSVTEEKGADSVLFFVSFVLIES